MLADMPVPPIAGMFDVCTGLAQAVPSLLVGDWLVLGAYFALLIGLGWWTNRRASRTTEDYFLAARSMPVWAVAFSILSTAQSAATYVGVPGSSYAGNLTYLAGNVGGILAALVLAFVFIPAYYRLNVATPYEMLERRFGPTGRLAAAVAYLVGRVFASGARVFVAAIPTSIVLVGRVDPATVAWCVLAFTLLGIALSLMGGVRSVIWIDVLQVAVYLGAAVATILVLLNRIPLSVPEIVAALGAEPAPATAGGGSKLTVLTFSTDPRVEFTFWTACTGMVLLTIASHGADQDLVQRMLTCKSARKGAWSVISGVLLGVPAVLIFLVLGLLLSIFYKRPDLMGAAAPLYAAGGDQPAFQVFAMREMTGGLAGLVVAGLFACGPAGINSGLSAMSSTFVNDIYRRLRPGRADGHYLAVGRWGVAGAGVALGLMALLCIAWYDPNDRSIISFVLSVMNFAYAGLLGVFMAALFTRRGTGRSVVAALVVGFLVTLAFQAELWAWLGRAGWVNVPPDAAGRIGAEAAKAALPWLTLAFPWQLTIGAAASLLACALPAGRSATGSPQNTGTRT